MVLEDMQECETCNGMYDANEGECPNCGTKEGPSVEMGEPCELPAVVIEMPKSKRRRCREDKIRRVLGVLDGNSRAKLTEISMRTGIPVSSVWEYMGIIEAQYDFTVRPKKASEEKQARAVARE